jgi:hypothetical protein
MTPRLIVPFLSMLFCTVAGTVQSHAETPVLTIISPAPNAEIILGGDQEKAVDVTVNVADFTLRPAGKCEGNPKCGHLHLKIDPAGDTCNIPGRPYNSMNSDVGGEVIKAHFGYCQSATGPHVIGILLANDKHAPVIIDGKPVTASVAVTAK